MMTSTADTRSSLTGFKHIVVNVSGQKNIPCMLYT